MSIPDELREHITAHLSAALPEDGGWRTLPAGDLVPILAGTVMSAISPALADLAAVQDALAVIADTAGLSIAGVGDAITDEVASVLAEGIPETGQDAAAGLWVRIQPVIEPDGYWPRAIPVVYEWLTEHGIDISTRPVPIREAMAILAAGLSDEAPQ